MSESRVEEILILVSIHGVILSSLFVESHNFDSVSARVISKLLQSASLKGHAVRSDFN